MHLPRPARWRAFAAARYRPFHAIAIGQALTIAYASDALFVPLLLRLGAPPSLVIVVGAGPIAGLALQGLAPQILRRMGGNLRRLTLLLALSELRGFVLAAIVAGVAAGVIGPTAGIALVALTVAVGQTGGVLSASNINLWTAVVLSEEQRRLVGPRMGALTMGLATILLLPAGAALDAASRAVGLWAYAAFFLVGGFASVITPIAVSRLPHPGRVRVSTPADGPTAVPVSFSRFVKASAIGSFGQGVLPYLSLYAIRVLGLSAGYAVMLSGVSSAGALLGSLLAGSFLLSGSASRVLRASLGLRAVAALLAAIALPGNPAAAVLLLVSTALFNGSGNAGLLATNERLYRLAPPEIRVRCQGRFVAWTSGAAAAGALVCAAALSVEAPQAWLVYPALFAISGVSRTVSALRLEVSSSWRSPLARTAPTAGPAAGLGGEPLPAGEGRRSSAPAAARAGPAGLASLAHGAPALAASRPQQ